MRTKDSELGKRCHRCHKMLLKDEFYTPRMRICMSCHMQRRKQGLQPTPEPLPPRATGPGLTTTPEGYAKYQRERARARARPVSPPAVMPEQKLCRRCQVMKPLSKFASWRVRVCLACDGVQR